MNKFEQLEEKYPAMIVLQLQGLFYIGYEKSAFALSTVTGYQVRCESNKSRNKCGFPSSVLNKVVNQLKQHKVSYVVIDGTQVVDIKDFDSENKFMEYVNLFNKDTIKRKNPLTSSQSGFEENTHRTDRINSGDEITCTFIGTDHLDACEKLISLIQGKDVIELKFEGLKDGNEFILKGKIFLERTKQ